MNGIKPKILAIVGPTASGKTSAAIDAALKLNGEIISADSRQIYKGIPIASAIPNEKERKGVPHHFIEELNLTEDFSAGEYGKQARKDIISVVKRGKTPIICGGSGLYIRALIDGFFEEEIDTSEARKLLYEKLKMKGKEFLYNELVEIDKIAAAAMMPHQIRRIIRALEIYYASGKKMSDLQKQNESVPFEAVQFALSWERKELYKRINERVDEMLNDGLINEVETLKDSGLHYKTQNALNTVGVKEVFRYLEGELNLYEMTELLKQNTRRYAKRQLTWFRADKRIIWIEMDEMKTIDEAVNEIISTYKSLITS